MEETVIFDASRSISGWGTSVWIYDNSRRKGTITYTNGSNRTKEFTLTVDAADIDRLLEIEILITATMKEYGKQSDFWSILKEKIDNAYGLNKSLVVIESKTIENKNKAEVTIEEDATLKEESPKMIMKDFRVFFDGKIIGRCDELPKAQKIIDEHDSFKKSHYGKRRDASPKNPNQKSSFKIYDEEGYGWNIK